MWKYLINNILTPNLLQTCSKITPNLLQTYSKLTPSFLQTYAEITRNLLQIYFRLTWKLLKTFFKLTLKLLWTHSKVPALILAPLPHPGDPFTKPVEWTLLTTNLLMCQNTYSLTNLTYPKLPAFTPTYSQLPQATPANSACPHQPKLLPATSSHSIYPSKLNYGS